MWMPPTRARRRNDFCATVSSKPPPREFDKASNAPHNRTGATRIEDEEHALSTCARQQLHKSFAGQPEAANLRIMVGLRGRLALPLAP